MARKPLGRGLSALLGEGGTAMAQAVAPRSTGEVDIELISPNPEQPRTRFAEDALGELARSISVNGIVQPIVVRRNGSRYEIVAGERRWRAAQRAGLRKIPVAIKEVSDDKMLELALIENIQRQELNPIEEARAYRKLIDNIGLTQEELSLRVGRERSLIATTIRLLQLPEEIQTLIEDEKLSAGHGRALLMAEDRSLQRRLARKIIDDGLSVRDAERLVKRITSMPQLIETQGVMKNKDPNVALAETKLKRRLGTNVKINPKKGGKAGRIEIEYYTSGDLDRIYQLIMTD
ncbi:MAG: ParB/RepB/Spo0J family partition protein [Acidobacteria bacterium]|nr:ParB/RepB/Spo0J family partition protein [Acidobacteriota bacterium]